MRLVGAGHTCVRGGREVFAGLDFDAAAGEAVAVVGPNGAGKTSLLRLIAGLLRPAGGSIALEGGDDELTLAEQAHYLGHRDALKPALSVAENLVFWQRFLGGEEADAEASLATVGLGHIAHLPAAYLSAGQRRRLSIATADRGEASAVAVRRADLGARYRRHRPCSKASLPLISPPAASSIAATHLPLGVDTRELRIGEAA